MMFDITDKKKTPVPFRWGTITVVAIFLLCFHTSLADDKESVVLEKSGREKVKNFLYDDPAVIFPTHLFWQIYYGHVDGVVMISSVKKL